jgi:hypothetical protein
MKLQNQARATLTVGTNQGSHGPVPHQSMDSEVVKGAILQILAQEGIDGATIRLALGIWEGETERSFEVVIIDTKIIPLGSGPSVRFLGRIEVVARRLADRLYQDAVLVTVDTAAVAFIAA